MGSFAQDTSQSYPTKKIAFSKDTISIEKFSLNDSFFEIKDANGTLIDSSFYTIDFQKGTLVFLKNVNTSDSLIVRYSKFPDFLTKIYSIYDDDKVVANEAGKLIVFKKEKNTQFKPFDGLNTSGSITRGITVGNNRNTVVNSNLIFKLQEKFRIKSVCVLRFRIVIFRCKKEVILKN